MKALTKEQLKEYEEQAKERIAEENETIKDALDEYKSTVKFAKYWRSIVSLPYGVRLYQATKRAKSDRAKGERISYARIASLYVVDENQLRTKFGAKLVKDGFYE